MSELPKVAIIYLSYHSDEYLPDMVEALKKSTYPKEKMALLMVDNPHPKFGPSVKIIQEIVLPLSKNSLPEVVVLAQNENKGFCGGNNAGMEWAIQNGFDYVFLHNQDGYVAPDCIEKMVSAMEQDKQIGCAQSFVILYGTNEINTAGNSFNYLGFGYIDNFGRDAGSISLKPVEEVGYASGAALMMRTSLIKEYGKLDEDLFAYHEDVEYSLRLRMLGLKPVVVSGAKFFHKYVFNRNSSKFYFMERNRYAVLLMYYKWPTLILLLPMLVVMELGLFALFVSKGWFKEKVNIYRYWLKPSNVRMWLNKRKIVQKLRKISDREFILKSTSDVSFGEKQGMQSPALKYLANPVMKLYGTLAKTLILW